MSEPIDRKSDLVKGLQEAAEDVREILSSCLENSPDEQAKELPVEEEEEPGNWNLQLARLKTKQMMERIFITYGMENAAHELSNIPLVEISPWHPDRSLKETPYMIYSGFCWSSTKQGVGYWNSRYKELLRRYQIENPGASF